MPYVRLRKIRVRLNSNKHKHMLNHNYTELMKQVANGKAVRVNEFTAGHIMLENVSVLHTPTGRERFLQVYHMGLGCYKVQVAELGVRETVMVNYNIDTK